MYSHLVPKYWANSSVRVCSETEQLNRTRGCWLALAIFLILGFMPQAQAQVTANIKGIITDPSGAAVPSATVTTKNMETGAVRTGVTDDAGRYLVLSLPVGEYEVKVSKPGF